MQEDQDWALLPWCWRYFVPHTCLDPVFCSIYWSPTFADHDLICETIRLRYEKQGATGRWYSIHLWQVSGAELVAYWAQLRADHAGDQPALPQALLAHDAQLGAEGVHQDPAGNAPHEGAHSGDKGLDEVAQKQVPPTVGPGAQESARCGKFTVPMLTNSNTVPKSPHFPFLPSARASSQEMNCDPLITCWWHYQHVFPFIKLYSNL